MDSDEKKSKKPGSAKEPKQRSGLARLLDFAGKRKAFTYLGCALSGISQLLSFGPFVCIWFVARDLIEVAPNWQNATNIATYGWAAVAFAAASIIVYFCALMCTHLAAFRVATNLHLGFPLCFIIFLRESRKTLNSPIMWCFTRSAFINTMLIKLYKAYHARLVLSIQRANSFAANFITGCDFLLSYGILCA